MLNDQWFKGRKVLSDSIKAHILFEVFFYDEGFMMQFEEEVVFLLDYLDLLQILPVVRLALRRALVGKFLLGQLPGLRDGSELKEPVSFLFHGYASV